MERDESMSGFTVFRGECTRNLDSKSRIVMPPQFKDKIRNNSFYVVCFPRDNFIRIYNVEELDAILENKIFVNGGGAEMQQIQRLIFSRLQLCELDGQNRFTIPQNLIEIAKVNKEVKMIGVGNRIELWNPDMLVDEFDNISDETLDRISFDF